MNIITIDPGTQLGYAGVFGAGFFSGTLDLAPQKTTPLPRKLKKMYEWLDVLNAGAVIATGRGVDIIGYEVPHGRGYAATHTLHAMVGVLELFAATHADHNNAMEFSEKQGAHIFLVGVHSAKLKKHSTGNGRAGKDDMSAACVRRWGVEPDTDHEADALCVLDYVVTEHSVTLPPLNRKQLG